MKIKCECGKIREISDEDMLGILEMHRQEAKKKEDNENALKEVSKAVTALEEQLKALGQNVKGLEERIKESDTKINEEI